MSTTTRVRPELLNIANPLHKGQRSINDVLVHITYRDGRPSVTEYASPGRAAMMLERYSRSRFIADSTLFAMVERVGPGHLVAVTPIDHGTGGYRSECETCGTVLRLHSTAGEADEWARLHATDPITFKHAEVSS